MRDPKPETTSTIAAHIRSGWRKGLWFVEPDRVSWVDPETGLDCLMRRHRDSLHWCGYVAVPSGHPWHGKGWDDVPADVHGGVTYCDKCDGDPIDGVDCAHAGDWSPERRGPFPGEVYRDAEYVRREVLSLAKQAKAASVVGGA